MPVSEEKKLIALVGATMIDGKGGAPIKDAAVIISGERIVSAGPRPETEVPKEAEVIDVSGKFLLPGLIDIHVHYQGWMGELFLNHGVTTVKDMGNDIEWINSVNQEIETGQVRGPRIGYVGNGLDAPPPYRDHHVGLETPEMARRAVRILHSRGVSAIKVREKITTELLQAVCDEAHSLGIPVTGHLTVTNARDAALAGIDGLEHATGVVEATAIHPKVPEQGLDDVKAFITELRAFATIELARVDDLIKALVEHDVALIPTMSTWWRMASKRREAFADEDSSYTNIPELDYLPPFIRQFLATSAIFKVQSAEDQVEIDVGLSKLTEVLRRHHAAGGKVLAGSDTIFAVPGLSLVRELIVLADAGFSAMDVIVMATRDNAAALGWQDSVGTIAPGLLADILVTNSDPLKDVSNLRRVDTVLKNGQVIDLTYQPGYRITTAPANLTRPLWLERELARVETP